MLIGVIVIHPIPKTIIIVMPSLIPTNKKMFSGWVKITICIYFIFDKTSGPDVLNDIYIIDVCVTRVYRSFFLHHEEYWINRITRFRTNLVSYVMNHENRSCIVHQTIVTIICFQIHRQQCSMPIICYEDQISISIANSTTWNMPRNLKNNQLHH
jgi:hypothetical protein